MNGKQKKKIQDIYDTSSCRTNKIFQTLHQIHVGHEKTREHKSSTVKVLVDSKVILFLTAVVIFKPYWWMKLTSSKVVVIEDLHDGGRDLILKLPFCELEPNNFFWFHLEEMIFIYWLKVRPPFVRKFQFHVEVEDEGVCRINLFTVIIMPRK